MKNPMESLLRALSKKKRDDEKLHYAWAQQWLSYERIGRNQSGLSILFRLNETLTAYIGTYHEPSELIGSIGVRLSRKSQNVAENMGRLIRQIIDEGYTVKDIQLEFSSTAYKVHRLVFDLKLRGVHLSQLIITPNASQKMLSPEEEVPGRYIEPINPALFQIPDFEA